MTAILKEFRSLVEVASKIKTIYSLASLIIVAIVTVVIVLMSFPSTPFLTIVVVVIFEIGLFLILIIITKKIPSPSTKPVLAESSDSTLKKNNLSVELSIWENIVYCLKQLGFINLEREKKITILNEDYYFSWAEHNSAKLLFLQLSPQELTVPNLRKVHSIMRIDLPNFAHLDVTAYIVICNTDIVGDACVEYLENLKERLKCICFTNYSLTKIQRKDDIGLTHMRAKLLPCAAC